MKQSLLDMEGQPELIATAKVISLNCLCLQKDCLLLATSEIPMASFLYILFFNSFKF